MLANVEGSGFAFRVLGSRFRASHGPALPAVSSLIFFFVDRQVVEEADVELFLPAQGLLLDAATLLDTSLLTSLIHF